jgi:hypothetical protein
MRTSRTIPAWLASDPTSRGRSAAAALQRVLPGVIAVNDEPLRPVIDDKPARMVAYFRLHKNQTAGDHFDGDA